MILSSAANGLLVVPIALMKWTVPRANELKHFILFYFVGTLSLAHPRYEPCNTAQHWYSACILLMLKVSYID